MFRRRTATSESSPRPSGLTSSTGPDASVGHGLAAELHDAGWVLPRGVVARADVDRTGPRWSLVGTVASPVVTAVDPAGLVAGEGWSLDWWIGADDRWRLPAQEAALRQQLVEDAPVVETLLRVPGGMAIHRAYGIRSPRMVGDEWVVSEIDNQTSIPFASVLVIRPFVADAVGSIGSITLEPVDGGRGRDVAHLVRVDGRPAVVLPRRPARVAVGNRETGDVVGRVLGGGAGLELVDASCPDGFATMAMIFPTAHSAVLRAVLPVGEVGNTAPGYPSVLPNATDVASGWEVHRRGPRFEIPEVHLAAAVERARAQIQLAHDGVSVRRDGHRSPDLEPGVTEVILGAFDVLDRPVEVGTVVARWVGRLATPTPEVDVLFLATVSRHWLLHRVDALLDWMLPEVAAAVERIDRADRKGRLTGPTARHRATAALSAAGRMLRGAGQGDAAAAIAVLEQRLSVGAEPAEACTADQLLHASHRLASGDSKAMTELDAIVKAASTTGAWAGPGPGGRPIGEDLAAAAAVVLAARSVLFAERSDGVAILPVHPDGWYGAGIEVHDAPTEWGRLSYAIRWHGIRPALLWEFAPHDGVGPVRLTAPGLDPLWSTTEERGDALLGEVVPPRGLRSIAVVSEHPDIDPVMRRPAADPSLKPKPPAVPDGGSFS